MRLEPEHAAMAGGRRAPGSVLSAVRLSAYPCPRGSTHEVSMAFELDPGEQLPLTPTTTPALPPRRTGRTGRQILDWAKTLASAGLYATLILTFVGQIARVDGLSMEPTLENSDRLVVNKWIYLV